MRLFLGGGEPNTRDNSKGKLDNKFCSKSEEDLLLVSACGG